MKNFIYLFILLAGLFSMTSCDGFLSKDPISQLAPDRAWKTQNDASRWMSGVYDGLQNTMRRNFWSWGECRGDNFKPYYDNSIEAVMVLNNALSGSNLTTQKIADWSPLYITISRCNFGLKYFPGMQAKNIEGAADIYKDYIGQCYGLRAMMYFYGLRVWGRMPLVTTPIENSDQNFYFARSSIDSCKALILSDLDNAIANLNSDDRKLTFSLGAAYALQAEVHLWFHEYDQALASIARLEALKLYSWVANKNEWKSIFLTPESSSEAIFSLPFNYLEDANGNGYGELFASNGTSFLYSISDDMYKTLQSHNVKTVSYDARYALCLDTLTAPTAVSYLTYSGGIYYCKGYAWDNKLKLLATTLIPGGFVIPPKTQSNAKTPMIRYADVELMKAEILARKGQYQGALDIVNAVRKRVGYKSALQPQFSNPSVDIYQCVMDERRVELMGEGSRWFDMIRGGSGYNAAENHPEYDYLNAAMDVVASQKPNRGMDGLSPFRGSGAGRVLFPIVSDAFSDNPLLRGDQNPGYSE